MPRKERLTVEDFAALRPERSYKMRVCSVKKKRKPPCLLVDLEHLDEPQVGRLHRVTLSLPIRPQGPTASFFRAAGVNIAAGCTLVPADTVGQVIIVRFSSAEDGGEWTVSSFEAARRNHDGSSTT